MYEINININGDIDSTSNTAGVSSGVKNKQSEQEKAQKNLGKFVASQTIQPFIQNVKTQVSQNIGLVTGNTELQTRVNNAFAIVQYGQQVYTNAQAGAVIGQGLGLGSGVGAMIGVVLSVVNTAIEVGMNKIQLDINKRLENYQIEQLKTRSGMIYNKSRMGGSS